MNVLSATKNSRIIRGTTESIAAVNVTSKGGMVMSREQFEKEKMYQATMSIARTMLKNRLITQEEYCQIDTMFTERYGAKFGTLFSEITCYSEGKE